MLPPDMTVKKISQFTLQNNELNAKVLYTFQKPMQYYYQNNGWVVLLLNCFAKVYILNILTLIATALFSTSRKEEF